MISCPGCGADMKIVPAGISKSTGKAYESFETCSARCGFKVNQKPGFKSFAVESHLPSKVPVPNGESRDRTMVMAYAKDIIVARIAAGIVEPGDSAHQIIAIYRQLMSELTNPMGGV